MQQYMPGIHCPVCHGFIPMPVQHLLFDKGFVCPSCGLGLNVDRKKSAKALALLAKVSEAQRKVEETSHFSK